MAKKSAMSKGYRRQTAKKPYLSKKEIAVVCIIVAIIAVGAFFLFRYDDGALKIKDGAVVADGDNWLIVDGSNTPGRPRYFRLGEMGEIDGFSREKSTSATDGNVPQYVFTPAGGDEGASISVTCAHSPAETLADYTRNTLNSLGTAAELGEVQSAEFAGQTTRYYLYTTEPAQEDAERATDEPAEAADEPADETTETTDEAAEQATDEAEQPTDEATEATDEAAPKYTRALAGYFDSPRENCCVIVFVESSADTAEGRLDDEALTALLEKAVAAVTLDAVE